MKTSLPAERRVFECGSSSHVRRGLRSGRYSIVVQNADKGSAAAAYAAFDRSDRTPAGIRHLQLGIPKRPHEDQRTTLTFWKKGDRANQFIESKSMDLVGFDSLCSSRVTVDILTFMPIRPEIRDEGVAKDSE